VLYTTLVVGFALQTAMAQDVVQVAPQQYKVLLENERVRVLDYQSKPGEKAGMYAHLAQVFYSLSPATLTFTSPVATRQGTTNAHGLVIELKK
jgi:hypothetical protein